jgi:hypothetical protein
MSCRSRPKVRVLPSAWSVATGDPRFPRVSPARRQELLIVKGELEAEAPRGAAADPFTAQQEREQAREPVAQTQQAQQDKKPEKTADQGT